MASDPTVKTDRLWHDKYSLRKSMIPTFITMDQARKVDTHTNTNYLILNVKNTSFASTCYFCSFSLSLLSL